MIFVGKKNSTSFFLLISLILGLALYTALFSSCVYEDLSKCSRMFMLQPRYLLHTGEGDRFGEAVHHIDVYAFDSLGIYRKMFRDKGAHLKNGYRMPIDLPEGKWTFLCLGGKVGDYEIGIFKTGIPQQFSPAVSPGITTLSDFRVKAYFEQKENLEYSFGELFFGRLDSVEITADNGGTGVVDLMKNTNKIEVRVKGIADGSSARITSDNGRFNSENVTPADAGTIIYVPYYSASQTDDTRVFQFDVLRLYTDGHLFLKLLNPDGTDVIPGFTKDLINAIMSSPAYHTQEDLDREDTYLIELVLSKDGVIISLRVNGWETISTTPEV